MPHLDDVFVGVCNLIADVDTEVKNGTALFDRLLREIVTEAATESIRGADVAARVVPLLRGHMGVVNPYVRQLLVGWITELDRVPGVDMLDYLGDLLEGLFDMLSDGNREVRRGTIWGFPRTPPTFLSSFFCPLTLLTHTCTHVRTPHLTPNNPPPPFRCAPALTAPWRDFCYKSGGCQRGSLHPASSWAPSSPSFSLKWPGKGTGLCASQPWSGWHAL